MTSTLSKYVRHLGGGELTARIRYSDLPLDQMCDFALRNNPNRKLLVVSRIAGRHIPVRPRTAWQAYETLAAKLPSDISGPMVFVGLAESAIGIGHAVYDAYKRRSGRDDTLFIHTSRHRLENSEVVVDFKEEHSHATDEFMYKPSTARQWEIVQNAKRLVVIDDELTTGKTIANLVETMAKLMPCLESLTVANLTDWRAPEHEGYLASRVGMPTDVISLLKGEMDFVGGPAVTKMPALLGNNRPKDAYCSPRFGRLGISDVGVPEYAMALARKHVHGRTLVLATEEFAFPPFALATQLENEGHDVVFQSTTRTPVIVGHGAMQCAMTFRDNYGDNIANFAYNVAPGMYDTVLLCHETPTEALDPSLVQALGAETVRFA